MIILKSKIKQIKLGYYALVYNPDTLAVDTVVTCMSGLKSNAWLDYLDNLESNLDITNMHKLELIGCSHQGKKHPTRTFIDTEIGLGSIDLVEVKEYIDSVGLSFYFDPDDTLSEMVVKLDALGYYFQRKTSNNIT